MLPRANEHVRINWPDHPTHGLIGLVVGEPRGGLSGYYRVALEDHSERYYGPAELVRVRQVITWVDAE